MMRSEFIERTGYEPSSEEYALIEEIYYDFPGDKNEFCKWWLGAKECGFWAMEMRLRDKLADLEMSRDEWKGIAKEWQMDAENETLRADAVERKLEAVRVALR